MKFNFARPLYVATTARQRLEATNDTTITINPLNDPRHGIGRMRTYGELLGLFKKAVEFTLDEGNANALRLILQSFLNSSASNSNMLQNPDVTTTKGQPRNKDSRCRPHDLVGAPYRKKKRQFGRSITSLERPAVSIADTTTVPPGQGVILHHVLDNGHTRQCSICRRIGVTSTDHDARTCTLRTERPTIQPLHELSLSKPQVSQAMEPHIPSQVAPQQVLPSQVLRDENM